MVLLILYLFNNKLQEEVTHLDLLPEWPGPPPLVDGCCPKPVSPAFCVGAWERGASVLAGAGVKGRTWRGHGIRQSWRSWSGRVGRTGRRRPVQQSGPRLLLLHELSRRWADSGQAQVVTPGLPSEQTLSSAATHLKHVGGHALTKKPHFSLLASGLHRSNIALLCN